MARCELLKPIHVPSPWHPFLDRTVKSRLSLSGVFLWARRNVFSYQRVVAHPHSPTKAKKIQTPVQPHISKTTHSALSKRSKDRKKTGKRQMEKKKYGGQNFDTVFVVKNTALVKLSI